MTSTEGQVTLKKVVGAMLFASKKTITAAELKKIIDQTAEHEEAAGRQFAKTKESEICGAMEQIKADLTAMDAGLRLAEVAGGYRLQTDPACGPWLRQLLNSGRPSRLSKPTLETLAIIAYRQPIARSEIESVRGVNVDNIVRHLLECQLIKICGRSDLPGHPLLYGTTQLFLEHFGLQDISHLPGIEQLRRKEAERIKAAAAKPAGAEQVEKDSGEEELDEDDPEEDDDEVEDEVEDDDDEDDEEDDEDEDEDEAREVEDGKEKGDSAAVEEGRQASPGEQHKDATP